MLSNQGILKIMRYINDMFLLHVCEFVPGFKKKSCSSPFYLKIDIGIFFFKLI